jgi:hypothetical protein
MAAPHSEAAAGSEEDQVVAEHQSEGHAGA